MTLFRIPGAVLVVLLFAVSPALSGEGSLTPGQKQEVREVVRQYLRDNPEVLVESIQALQAKRDDLERDMLKDTLVSLRGEIEKDPATPVAGNPDGDVTIVEFFDYRCGFCKRALPGVLELLKSDGNIRYVFKEFPILGPQSVYAARAALAVWSMDKEKYMPFHIAMMSSKGGLTEDKVFSLAAKGGIDADALRAAMEDPRIEKTLSRGRALAEALNITGTPAFIIGDNVNPGVMDAEQLKQAVADARKG